MKSTYYLILFFALTGCINSYKLNNNSISAGRDFDQGFVIEKIIVDSVYKKDLASKMYSGQDGNFKSTRPAIKGHPITFKVDSSSMLIFDKGSPLNKIYFDQPNEGYYWILWQISNNKYETLPLHFLPNQWYHFGNLPGPLYDNEYHIYLHVKNDGTFETFEDYTPGPF
jgi:hypothetical protein